MRAILEAIIKKTKKGKIIAKKDKFDKALPVINKTILPHMTIS